MPETDSAGLDFNRSPCLTIGYTAVSCVLAGMCVFLFDCKGAHSRFLVTRLGNSSSGDTYLTVKS